MKKIKRILAICLSMLLVGGIMSFSAFAADDDAFTIFVASDKEKANVGDTVNISAVLEPGGHIGALTIDLLYDKDSFEYVYTLDEKNERIETAVSPLTGGLVSINSKEPGKITLSFMSEGSLYSETDQTVLMTAQFKVLKGNGKFNIDLKTIGCDDFDGTDITTKGTVRGLTLAEAEAPCPHEGQEATPWQSNEAEHWQICTACGAIINKAAHTYGDWTVVKEPTETEAGSKERVCSVCGHKDTKEIPKLVPSGGGKIVVSDAAGQAGTEVSVTVSLKDNPGIAAMTLGFEYDTDKLELLSVSENKDFAGMWTVNVEGKGAVYANMGGDVDSDGLILTLTFKIKDEAEIGSSQVNVSCEAGNWAQEKINFTVVPGAIIISNHTPGDINGSGGEPDVMDLISLMKYLAKENVDVVEDALDVDHDGKPATVMDLILLMKYLAKEPVVIY